MKLPVSFIIYYIILDRCEIEGRVHKTPFPLTLDNNHNPILNKARIIRQIY